MSQESVKQFYENWLSRQNTLSSLEDQDGCLPPPLSPPADLSSHYAYAKLKNQVSKVSWGSSFSRWISSGIFVNLTTVKHPSDASLLLVAVLLYSHPLPSLLTFSCMTEETMICSRQLTQEELDELPVTPGTPADQLRRRFVRTTNIDLTPAETGEISPG